MAQRVESPPPGHHHQRRQPSYARRRALVVGLRLDKRSGEDLPQVRVGEGESIEGGMRDRLQGYLYVSAFIREVGVKEGAQLELL